MPTAARHPLHRLQSAAGNKAVQRFVESLGDKVPKKQQDREAQERTTLLVLAGQAARMTEPSLSESDRRQVRAFQGEIDELLRAKPRDRGAIDGLVARVNDFVPTRTKEVGMKPVPLENDEWPALESAFGRARDLIEHAEDEHVTELFGQARTKVKANLAAIAAHLAFWQSDPGRCIRVDRTGANTLNSGVGQASRLILAGDFASRARFERTLIHEASHGCERVQTVDYAYASASYFRQLPPEVALKNADSYAYAADGEALRALPERDHADRSDLIERACFVVSENWKHAMWLIEFYTSRRATNQVSSKHSNLHRTELGFKDKKDHVQLRLEHVAVLRDFFHLAGAYLCTGCEVTLTDRTGSLLIHKDGMSRLKVRGFLAMSEEDRVDALLRAVARSRDLPLDFGEVKWSKALFEWFFVQARRSAEDKAMWKFVSSPRGQRRVGDEQGKGKERERS